MVEEGDVVKKDVERVLKELQIFVKPMVEEGDVVKKDVERVL